MSIFVDTSALLSVLDGDAQHHHRAAETWERLLSEGQELLCSNYVLVETVALVQKRLGLAAVRALYEDVVPVLQVKWVEPEVHGAAVQTMLTAGRRELSLVDCTSFILMRHLGLDEAFTFDRDFARQGFRCRP